MRLGLGGALQLVLSQIRVMMHQASSSNAISKFRATSVIQSGLQFLDLALGVAQLLGAPPNTSAGAVTRQDCGSQLETETLGSPQPWTSTIDP
eukprot:2085216-Rhodomonas_salina.2